jgi:hypothetical protein
VLGTADVVSLAIGGLGALELVIIAVMVLVPLIVLGALIWLVVVRARR